ncbi:Nucleolar complex protein 2 -like protein [Toxocara canis]|uniref:Nucleolar complex protein 2-like protein n=1 Tax=Toxocara canis TaxID=6265 RepID=A0A0B2UJ37_TOXCA|nr:Nucleolar complex protein 2 -like protein [Toxocara canis]
MACVARVGANIDPPDFAINDNKVFDEVVRLCFKHLGAALFEALGLAEEKSTVKGEKWDGEERCKIDKRTSPSRFKRWKKWSVVVKQYLQALLLFLNEVQNADVMVCTLRAVAQVVELYLHFSKLSRNLVKSVVRIWSRKCLECRVSSMLVLSKIVRLDKHLYPVVLKSCYLGYVSNAREVTPESYPLISFMEKAFVEICHIYPSIAYPYAFVYIRQTAIHLRNAMIAKRKELIQTVYNWQFVQCLYLWAGVISKACRSDNEENIAIAELVYPLSQVTIATMRLVNEALSANLLKHFSVCSRRPLTTGLRVVVVLRPNITYYIP